MIVFAAIVPHPPESVPGIGNGADLKRAEKTIKAFDRLRIGLESSFVDTVVVISPHAEMEPYNFVINSEADLVGNFSQFGLDMPLKFKNDIEIADALGYASLTNEISTHLHPHFLDYGTLVPLYHLTKNMRPAVVHLSFSMMSYDYHYAYGEVLGKILEKSPKRIAIVASGDLSHRLSHDSPAGFSPRAQEFDRLVLFSMGENSVAGLMDLELDKNFLSEAAECGLRSFIILYGALKGKPYKFDLLSYESPFGIGYLVARLL